MANNGETSGIEVMKEFTENNEQDIDKFRRVYHKQAGEEQAKRKIQNSSNEPFEQEVIEEYEEYMNPIIEEDVDNSDGIDKYRPKINKKSTQLTQKKDEKKSDGIGQEKSLTLGDKIISSDEHSDEEPFNKFRKLMSKPVNPNYMYLHSQEQPLTGSINPCVRKITRLIKTEPLIEKETTQYANSNITESSSYKPTSSSSRIVSVRKIIIDGEQFDEVVEEEKVLDEELKEIPINIKNPVIKNYLESAKVSDYKIVKRPIFNSETQYKTILVKKIVREGKIHEEEEEIETDEESQKIMSIRRNDITCYTEDGEIIKVTQRPRVAGGKIYYRTFIITRRHVDGGDIDNEEEIHVNDIDGLNKILIRRGVYTTIEQVSKPEIKNLLTITRIGEKRYIKRLVYIDGEEVVEENEINEDEDSIIYSNLRPRKVVITKTLQNQSGEVIRIAKRSILDGYTAEKRYKTILITKKIKKDEEVIDEEEYDGSDEEIIMEDLTKKGYKITKLNDKTATVISKSYIDTLTDQRRYKIVVRIKTILNGSKQVEEQEHNTNDIQSIIAKLKETGITLSTKATNSVKIIRKPILKGREKYTTNKTFIIKSTFINGYFVEEEEEVDPHTLESVLARLTQNGYKVSEKKVDSEAKLVKRAFLVKGQPHYKFNIITKSIKDGIETKEKQETDESEEEIRKKLATKNIRLIKPDPSIYIPTAIIFRRPNHNTGISKVIVITRTIQDGYEVEETEEHNLTEEEIIINKFKSRGFDIIRTTQQVGRIVNKSYINISTGERKWGKLLFIRKIKNGTEYQEIEEYEDLTQQDISKKVRLRGITLEKPNESKTLTYVSIVKTPLFCDFTGQLRYKSVVRIRSIKAGEESEYEEIFDELNKDVILEKLREKGLKNIRLWQKLQPRARLERKVVVSSHHKDRQYSTVALIQWIRNGTLVEEEEEFQDGLDDKIIISRIRQRGIIVMKTTKLYEKNCHKLVRKAVTDQASHHKVSKNVLITKTIRNGQEIIEKDTLSESDEEIAIEKLKIKGIYLKQVIHNRPSVHILKKSVVNKITKEVRSKTIVSIKKYINGYEVEEEEEGADLESTLHKIQEKKMSFHRKKVTEVERKYYHQLGGKLTAKNEDKHHMLHLLKKTKYFNEDEDVHVLNLRRHLNRQNNPRNIGSKKLNKVKVFDDYLMLYDEGGHDISLSYNDHSNMYQDNKLVLADYSHCHDKKDIDLSFYQPIIFDNKHHCYRAIKENEIYSKEEIVDPSIYNNPRLVDIKSSFYKVLRVSISELRRKVAEKLEKGETDIILTAKDFKFNYSSSSEADEQKHYELISKSEFSLRLSQDLIFNYYSNYMY
jgi:hypothetical protein